MTTTEDGWEIGDHALAELIRERDHLIDKAHRALEEGVKELLDLRHELNLAANQEPYRRSGNQALIPPRPIDLSVVNAAFDAIERVASLLPNPTEVEEPETQGALSARAAFERMDASTSASYALEQDMKKPK